MFLKIFCPKLLLKFFLRLLDHKTCWRNFFKNVHKPLRFSFLLRDCLWGIVYSFLHEDEQDPSTFSSSKSLKVLDILTVFKEFLRAEDDFQQISSGITSYKGKHWFRAAQFWLNSRNVNSREDQILYTLYYYQTLLALKYMLLETLAEHILEKLVNYLSYSINQLINKSSVSRTAYVNYCILHILKVNCFTCS